MIATKRHFIERAMSGRPLIVDSKMGVIRNVKVLGLLSVNGRKYLPEAVKAAAPLYENVRVNIDHPEEDPSDQRSAYDRFGKLVNIKFVPGEGLYGDLEYLTKHPMAPRIVEAAQRMPDAFGLSHNAQGEGEEDDNGIFVVRRISEVRHVDLVADPATTKSLKESVKTKKLVKEDFEPFSAWKQKIERMFGGSKGRISYEVENQRHEGENYKVTVAYQEKTFRQSAGSKKVGQFIHSKQNDSKGDGSYLGESKRRPAMGKKLTEGDLLIKHIQDCIMREDLEPAEKAKRVCELHALGMSGAGYKKESDDKDADDVKEGMDDEKGVHVDIDSHKGSSSDKVEGESDGVMPDDFKEGDGMLPDQYKEGDDEGKMEGDDEVYSTGKPDMKEEGEDEKDAMEGDDEDEDDVKEGDDEDADDVKESATHKRTLKALQEEIRSMKREARIRRVCESVRLPLTKSLLSDLMCLPAASLERHVKRLAEAHHVRKPKSYGPGLLESKGKELPSGEELFNWLRS